MRKRIVCMLVGMLAICGVSLIQADSNVAYAAEIGSVYKDTTIEAAPDFISEYTTITADKVAPKVTTEGYEDWLFAGWYSAQECTEDSVIKDKSTVTEAWAKYVPADVLTVKIQMLDNTTAESTNTNMRFVSTVDTLNYGSVGFVLEHRGDNGEILSTKPISTSTVFRHIEASAESGVAFEYNAKVIDAKSEWIITATLANIPQDNFGDVFVIKPYWTTYDGTTVYGQSRYAKVSDCYTNIVNVPVVVDDNCDVASLTVDGVAPSEVRYYDGEKYADLMVAVSDREALASLTKYTVSDGQVGYYRNLLTAYEESSADSSWYSLISDEYEYVIATDADLWGLAVLVNGGNTLEGTVVYLGSGITLFEGDADDWKADSSSRPASSWTPIGTADAAFKGTFDGCLETVDGLYVSTTNQHSGLFGYAGLNSTIKSLKISNSYLNTNTTTVAQDCYYLGGVVGWLKGSVDELYVGDDVTIIHTGNSSNMTGSYLQSATGGIAGRFGGDDVAYTTKITNSWFAGIITTDNDCTGGIVGAVYRGKVIFENCLYTGSIINTFGSNGNKYAHVGGILGGLRAYSGKTNAYLTMSGCLATGTVSVSANVGVGSLVGRTQYVTMDLDNVYTTDNITTSYADGMLFRGTVSGFGDYSLSNNIVLSGSPSTIVDTELNGIQAYVYTDLDFYSVDNEDGAWVAISGATPELRVFTTAEQIEDDFTDVQRVDTTWYYNDYTVNCTKTNSYSAANTTTNHTINTADQMRGLAKIVNDGVDTFSEMTVTLGNDIILNEGNATDWQQNKNRPTQSWEPIGISSALSFQGTFDGNNHTISGLYMDVLRANSGLFGYAKSATIQNVRMSNSFLKAQNTTTVSATNTDTVTCVTNMGSIGGYFSGTMANVYSDAILESCGSRNGGLIGCVNGTATVTSCWFNGSLTIDYYGSAGLESGGIIGYINNPCTLDTCLYTGILTTTNYRTNDSTSYGISLGALVGTEHKSDAGTTITNCVSSGTITSTWKGSRYLEEGYSTSYDYSKAKIVYLGRLMGAYRHANTTATNNYSTTVITGIVDFSEQSTTDTTYAKVSSSFTTAASKVDNGVASALKMSSFADDALEYVMPYYITELSFARAEGDTTSAIWAVRNTDAKPIPETMLDIVEDEVSVARLAEADISWYSDDATEFTLYDAADLYGFAVLAWTKTFSGMTVKLGADITVNEGDAEDWAANGSDTAYLWIPIGGRDNSTSRFYGTFDGQNYTISGLYAENSMTYLGLFGLMARSQTVESTIKNVRLVNSYIHGVGGASYVGSIVGDMRGTLENVYSSAIVENDGSQTGGIAARSNGVSYTPSGATQKERFTVTMKNCWFDGKVIVQEGTSAQTYIGGISGTLVQGTANVTNCLYTGSIDSKAEPDSKEVYIGGICGGLMAQTTSGYVDGSDSTLNLNSVILSGTVTSIDGEEIHVASLVGMVTATDTKWSYLSLSNTYVDDSAMASYNAQREVGEGEKLIVTGDVIVGSEDYSGLDFESEEGWLTMENGVPIPKAFADIVSGLGEE